MPAVQQIFLNNLAGDFRAIAGNKLINESLVGGSAAPTAAPPEPLKAWLWINTSTFKISHFWNATTAAWVALTDPVVADFWRSGAGATALPDGTTDLTENIRRNGSVGINTDPLHALDVVGTTAANLFVAKRGTVEGGEIQIESFTGAGWVIDQVDAGGPRLRIFQGSPPSFLTITSTGFFGFGTPTPNTKAHITSGVANDSGLRLENLTSTTPSSPGGAIGVDATGKVIRVAAIQKFVITRALAAGANTITHNLGLASTFRASVEVRNATNGATIAVRVPPASYTANSLQVQVGVAVASAQIIIIG